MKQKDLKKISDQVESIQDEKDGRQITRKLEELGLNQRRADPIADIERAQLDRRVEEARAKRKAELRRQHESAREKAQLIWDAASPADPNHPYFKAKAKAKAKGVGVHGIGQRKGALLIPVKDDKGVLQSLQYINPDGKKRFLSGRKTKGHYHLIGEPKNSLYVCEGYARGATIDSQINEFKN